MWIHISIPQMMLILCIVAFKQVSTGAICEPSKLTEHYAKLYIVYQNFGLYLAKARCEYIKEEKMLRNVSATDEGRRYERRRHRIGAAAAGSGNKKKH